MIRHGDKIKPLSKKNQEFKEIIFSKIIWRGDYLLRLGYALDS